MEQQIANLPPFAMVAFTAVRAVIFGVRYFALWQGQNMARSSTTNAAQVAAVIVDPTALNRATAALEAHTEATTRLIDIVQEGSRHISTLAIEADRIREELRIQREIRRDRDLGLILMSQRFGRG